MTWLDQQNPQRRTAISTVVAGERGTQYVRYASGDRGFAAWLVVADAFVPAPGRGVDLRPSDWAWRHA